MYCEIAWVGAPEFLSKMNRRVTSFGIPIYNTWCRSSRSSPQDISSNSDQHLCLNFAIYTDSFVSGQSVTHFTTKFHRFMPAWFYLVLYSWILLFPFKFIPAAELQEINMYQYQFFPELPIAWQDCPQNATLINTSQNPSK